MIRLRRLGLGKEQNLYVMWKTRILALLMFLTFSVVAHAMCSDNIHQVQDYVDYAQKQPGADAVCLVVDDWLHHSLTGILIAPNKVLTAAHGFTGNPDTSLKMGRLYVHFGANAQEGVRYKVVSLRLHDDYQKASRHEKNKYDFAVLELEKPVKDVSPITPVATFDPDWEKDTFVVITFGSFDWPQRSAVPKRAFCVPELELQPLHEYDSQLWHPIQNVNVGSIFFTPKLLPKDQTETVIRSNRAFKRWQGLGKPPYALALPGSSGSPLICVREGKPYLLGMVSSFAPLVLTDFQDPGGRDEAALILSQDRDKVFNRYQTQFALLYQRKENLKKGDTWHLDPGVSLFLKGN